MSVLKKPDLTDPKLRAKLAKGMGHNYYGEPAWPNDLLYIFPVVILGTLACVIGLSVLSPSPMGEKADPFATPLEILPEWYFFPTFNLLRIIPNKLLGVLSMAAVPAILITVPFVEGINKFQNPFRRPIAMLVFLFSIAFAIWFGIGACLPISQAVTLIYLTEHLAPAASRSFLAASASALETPSFTFFGVDSTKSLASFSPSPVKVLTILRTAIFLSAGTSSNTKLNSVFSSATSSVAPLLVGAIIIIPPPTEAAALTSKVSSICFTKSAASNKVRDLSCSMISDTLLIIFLCIILVLYNQVSNSISQLKEKLISKITNI